MSRYIDADNYKKDLIQLGFLPALVVSVLDKQPTADVVEVRHGEWGFDGIGWTCSECGEYALKARVQKCSKFCPNCGAKMDGEGERDERN